jgi:hypothetical protein
VIFFEILAAIAHLESSIEILELYFSNLKIRMSASVAPLSNSFACGVNAMKNYVITGCLEYFRRQSRKYLGRHKEHWLVQI